MPGQLAFGGVKCGGNGRASVEAGPHVGQFSGVARSPVVTGWLWAGAGTRAVIELVNERRRLLSEVVLQIAIRAASQAAEQPVGEDGFSPACRPPRSLRR
jgi:hypothetical protein